MNGVSYMLVKEHGLSPEEQALFEKLTDNLAGSDSTVWLPAIEALREYAEKTMRFERPYRGRYSSFLPLSR